MLTFLGACPAYIATEFSVCGRHKERHFSRKRIDRPVPTAESLPGLFRRNLRRGLTTAATMAVRVGACFSSSFASSLHSNIERLSTDVGRKRDPLEHKTALSRCTTFTTSFFVASPIVGALRTERASIVGSLYRMHFTIFLYGVFTRYTEGFRYEPTITCNNRYSSTAQHNLLQPT